MDEAPPQEQEEEEEGQDEADVAPTTSSSQMAADWLQLSLGTTASPAVIRERSGRQPPPLVTLPELRLSGDIPSSPVAAAAAAAAAAAEPPGPTNQDPTRDMSVIRPPPRQTGLWLMLQVQQSQGEQPSLPQISRNYLRIRDGGMTVRLLIKYLVSKLSLEDESEVEITCRDQLLLPSFTLQYVRDNIWCPGNIPSILPNFPSIDHVMRLQYRRRTTIHVSIL
ncbi:protein LAX PANICLE 2-like isoform X2 [Zingiber officinale]|uniref:protein LAX PANICLE 2-like isoform X2 n=1 Tax=Zingiber officinale TaxID=94328 RepID=UPI001C4A985F|nr:protein LAX PANICLE 2-like isoform X2 [Zingiber officinale]